MECNWKEYNLDRQLSFGESIRRRAAIYKMEQFAENECKSPFCVNESLHERYGMFTLTDETGREANIGYSYDEYDVA